MRRSPWIAAASITLVIAAAARVISAEPRPPAEEPLSMTADQLDLDVEGKSARLTGHVKLTRGAVSVSCPRVELRYDDAPRVKWAKGSGGVVAEVKGARAEAPEVEIDFTARSLTLRGGVKITRGDGWITAERASIDMATARISMTQVKGSIPLPGLAPEPAGADKR